MVKCVNLTLVTRFIGFMCLIISVLLLTVGNSYDQSKLKVLALGLDWQQFYLRTNVTHESKQIFTTVAYYSSVQLITSAVLIYATISFNKWCVVPWLIWAGFSCISKIVRMCVHRNRMSVIFVLGSISYIAVMICCCIIVYAAQSTWKEKRVQFCPTTPTRRGDIAFQNLDTLNDDPTTLHHSPPLHSPIPYVPNINYGEI